jgi:hypothetical protein
MKLSSRSMQMRETSLLSTAARNRQGHNPRSLRPLLTQLLVALTMLVSMPSEAHSDVYWNVGVGGPYFGVDLGLGVGLEDVVGIEAKYSYFCEPTPYSSNTGETCGQGAGYSGLLATVGVGSGFYAKFGPMSREVSYNGYYDGGAAPSATGPAVGTTGYSFMWGYILPPFTKKWGLGFELQGYWPDKITSSYKEDEATEAFADVDKLAPSFHRVLYFYYRPFNYQD